MLAGSLAGMHVCALAADEKPAFETIARQALLFDASTRTVLFERRADEKIQPASLAKLMTAAIVFREVKEGRLALDRDMVVSVDAWRRGGAVSGNPNMLLTPNKVIRSGELLTGLIVGGANDAAITLAENIAGQESRFADLMNAEAARLGLAALRFRNATGYAAEGQEATLRDLVKLTAHIIETYPGQYPLFAQKDFPLRQNRQTSRNPLLTMDIGADGLITGASPETGQMIIGSAVQDGRRLIVALAGLESIQDRALESRKLIEWGFRRFEIRTLFPAGAEVGEVSVYGGENLSVPVKTKADIRLPVLRGSGGGAVLKLAWMGPVPAPVREGQPIARLDIFLENRLIQSAPLHAARPVAQGGLAARARDAAIELARQMTRDGFWWLIGKLRKRPPAEEKAKT